MANTKMKIDIWTDVVCPWCYIGKRRLEGALQKFGHGDEIELRWRSHQLDPKRERGTQEPVLDMLMRKYRLPRAQAESMQERVTGIAAGEGLKYRLDLTKSCNTLDAHRLTHLAETVGKSGEMQEALMRAYFVEGAILDDHDVLKAIAGSVGLNADQVTSTLASDRFAADVASDQAQAERYGFRGVPAFVMGGTHGVSGAEEESVFLDALQGAWAEHTANT